MKQGEEKLPLASFSLPVRNTARTPAGSARCRRIRLRRVSPSSRAL